MKIAMEAKAPTVKPIEWGLIQKPCERCRYDHVIGKTPLGDILITWKGWQERPAYCIEESAFGLSFGVADSLEGIKGLAEKQYRALILKCLDCNDGGSDD